MLGMKVHIIDYPTLLTPENAIPIEGWISDPTDNDLLHLIPFLQALRFVGDVRSLLGLRTGARQR
jgi:CTD nuclear envelope phosphatase 1